MLGRVVTAVALCVVLTPLAQAGVCEIGKKVQPISHWQQVDDAALQKRWCRVSSLAGLHRMDVDKYQDKGWHSVARASQQALDACTGELRQLKGLLEARSLAPPQCPE
ncbi:hypothetical protein Fbal_3745 [Ferrimonas balearica DSM 9799]|uniref:Uncharacterized protein n=1 Tax=Ferrimonas balearica (strain DSM 9799 / CCM 4581 / KCTC 23876 / PAT) TaxID=550540 RepID=E1SR08_FERBD|nr:hypothetical protein [Ferrimonas balearica]ADN77938.1 hypothetical protein Fbal_3745 [Ferrimonas balearica DSM 9799]MBY5982130.1 hypothetical protein [Ferrimonas balearica]MBY6226038.1 hypothetical protein [Ferrimonas balearica]